MTARLILVDDHPVILAGLRALVLDLPELELVGQASCASEAFALVRSQRPDVAILDMGLPGMSGLTLAERVLEEAPDMRIVMLTHYEEPSYVQKALRIGIRGYVLKASADEKVAQAIRTVLSGGVYIDSDLEDFRAEWILKLCPTAGAVPAAAADTLTYREMQVLRLAAVGHSNKEIARRIGLGIKSVETYRYRACKKLMLHSRLDIIRYGASHGWILDI
ncbi:DNA-binding response regulator, NarL/FixJ family, contains REC and HTH domains [Bosea sp. CRIB-10]|jgi:DNA-binding NarL/FixJ family response regulator|uniref:response regulator n=1 Tax=Bosea sp. CRIB-10 TaxID=378404 RepID=UPI0008E62046|nr:response regulator transcription factor [Bosea sp. CRIB-10]SFB72507.1 DNA-binding response regulator, NarL/FixJ family, contains REC and HTH domains [Bosea sp. CRIB-10]